MSTATAPLPALPVGFCKMNNPVFVGICALKAAYKFVRTKGLIGDAKEFVPFAFSCNSETVQV